MNCKVVRVWHIRVITDSPERGDCYAFIDKNNTPKNRIKMLFWSTFQKDMFDRPELEVTYYNANETIELVAANLAKVFCARETSSVFVKISK